MMSFHSYNTYRYRWHIANDKSLHPVLRAEITNSSSLGANEVYRHIRAIGIRQVHQSDDERSAISHDDMIIVFGEVLTKVLQNMFKSEAVIDPF